jgi:hypothetical protein
MLNLRRLRIEGYEFTGCKWYKNDEFVFEGYTYSVGPKADDRLKAGDRYVFELATSNRGTLRSTEKTITGDTKSATGILAYPNPVSSGSALAIEGVAEGALIEVYSRNGACLYRTIATSNPATLTVNFPAGVYVIRAGNDETKVIIEN